MYPLGHKVAQGGKGCHKLWLLLIVTLNGKALLYKVLRLGREGGRRNPLPFYRDNVSHLLHLPDAAMTASKKNFIKVAYEMNKTPFFSSNIV